MEETGYRQYEISNFCLPGYESRHNSAYWKGIPYLGVGPSAHSFNGYSRRWNVANLTTYITHLKKDQLLYEEEILTPDQQYNEYVMTSLRTDYGCDSSKIRHSFGYKYEQHFRKASTMYLQSGHLKESDGVFRLSRQGKFLADRISADLFIV